MKPILVLSVLILLTSCAINRAPINLGAGAHKLPTVSFSELLGSADRHHGTRVRIVGVLFASQLGDAPKIFMSKEHLLHYTNEALELPTIESDFPAQVDKLQDLHGRYVLLEGVFHRPNREHLDGQSGVCVGCPYLASLEDINRISEWFWQ